MKKISSRKVFQGNWLAVREDIFSNGNGEKIHWETIERNGPNLGIIVLAKLVPSNRYILIKQFRIPLESYIIGLPAGIVPNSVKDEAGLKDHVLRELKEETGYTGKIISYSPKLKSSSGLINETHQTFYVKVDELAPENLNPVQELEPAEDIEVIIKKRDEIRDFLFKEAEAGTQIGGAVWYLFGFERI